jgi:hypothetical protein
MCAKRRTSTKKKEKSRRKVTVTFLKPKHAGKVPQAYALMDELIEKHHHHLKEARIAICWRHGWNTDTDGHLKNGQCKKASDCDRALKEFDFVVLLNHEVWNSDLFDETQKRATMDHELSHAQVSMDRNGEPLVDEEGRTVYRLRGHDIEEFTEVVARYDTYNADLERFAAQLLETKDRPLLPPDPPPKVGKKAAGTRPVHIDDAKGGGQLRRARESTGK